MRSLNINVRWKARGRRTTVCDRKLIFLLACFVVFFFWTRIRGVRGCGEAERPHTFARFWAVDDDDKQWPHNKHQPIIHKHHRRINQNHKSQKDIHTTTHFLRQHFVTKQYTITNSNTDINYNVFKHTHTHEHSCYTHIEHIVKNEGSSIYIFKYI